MIVLFDFCSIHWIFPWLLPALLGLGLGWLLWGKYKALTEDREREINTLKLKIQGLESELATCRSARMEVEGNLALLRGRMREMEAGLTTIKGAEPITTTGKSASLAVMGNTQESDEDRWFAAIGSNNLQIIEGVGPKMEEILHENGINDFYKLASTDAGTLRTILNKYGDKYRIIDPNTWPHQASLARDKKWNELIELQKTLDTGRSDTPTDGQTDSKLEKWLIKKGIIRRWTTDDLKAVEGIGPKIEVLLHDAGIRTWKALADTPTSRIQEILDAAGPRYALADPATWPKQADMAANGKWDELQAYQDMLNAGKPKK
jgi:predicted flap endonuclease-1-like 5' DNA nuclease